MEYINIYGTLAQVGDEVEVCTKSDPPECFRAKIKEIGGRVVMEKPEGEEFDISVESFRVGFDRDKSYRVRPYNPQEDPSDLIQKVLKILEEKQ